MYTYTMRALLIIVPINFQCLYIESLLYTPLNIVKYISPPTSADAQRASTLLLGELQHHVRAHTPRAVGLQPRELLHRHGPRPAGGSAAVWLISGMVYGDA